MNTATTTPQIQIRTAEQAREATEQVIRNQFQKELAKVSEAIETAIKQSETQTHINIVLPLSLVSLLKKMGYSVNFGVQTAIISW